MSDFYTNRPRQLFRIIRKSGVVEYVEAHEAALNDNDLVKFYGEFDKVWKVVLALAHSEIAEIRNLSISEPKLPIKEDIVASFRRLRSQWRKGAGSE